MSLWVDRERLAERLAERERWDVGAARKSVDAMAELLGDSFVGLALAAVASLPDTDGVED